MSHPYHPRKRDLSVIKQERTPLLMKYQDPIKLFAYGEGELNQKWADYLSWLKISKILLLCAVFSATTAQAENYPDLNDDGEFSLMGTSVSYTHLRAHETRHDLVCRLL